MNSQRVYMERQKPDGYINYRTGPYLDEEIPYNGQLTTSAPWYAWQNWEIYSMTHDRKFLEDAYASSAAFYRYYTKNRDSDGDGLCEWGAHAVLESVRDGMVAVWDQVGWPANFESVDLNAMLVSEAKSLAGDGDDLGTEIRGRGLGKGRPGALHEDQRAHVGLRRPASIIMWTRRRTRSRRRNPETSSAKRSSASSLSGPGSPTKDQAARLVAKLKDTSKFWREYGVPSLAADDRYYNPKGYWNGPMWVQWNYLIVRGPPPVRLSSTEARELTASRPRDDRAAEERSRFLGILQP